MNNFGRGCPKSILISDQKFLTKVYRVSFWLPRQPDFFIKWKFLNHSEKGLIKPVKIDEIPPSGLEGIYY